MGDEKDGELDASLSSLFMELASETRFLILSSLAKKPSRLSSLSRELNTTAQDVFRNLNRMSKEGLVKKSGSEFTITEYGSMVASQLPYFDFLRRHRDFFESHTFSGSGIPERFLLRLGELSESTMVGSVTAVLQRLKKLEASATSSLRVMVSQAWPEEGEIFIDRASHGVSVKSIVGHNTIVPKSVIETVGDPLEKLIKDGLFTAKMLEKVGVGIYIADDSQAGLMFPKQDGEVDMTALFVGSDRKFCGWCSDLFENFWAGAKRFDVNKTKIVE